MPDPILTPPGVATGRSARTYYQKDDRMSGEGGEYAADVTWNKVALISGSESFDPGKENAIGGEVRESGRKFQESGVQEYATLKFTYQRPRGVDDDVYDDLMASYVPDGLVYEWAVMDGDIEHVGTVGWRFFGEVVGLEHKRDLDKFIEYDVTVEERVKYEVEEKIDEADGPAVLQGLIPWIVEAPEA